MSFDLELARKIYSEWKRDIAKKKKEKQKKPLRIKLTIRGRKRSLRVKDLKAPVLFDCGRMIFPLVRRLNYGLIAQECFTVQPLPQPSASTYWFDEVTQWQFH